MLSLALAPALGRLGGRGAAAAEGPQVIPIEARRLDPNGGAAARLCYGPGGEIPVHRIKPKVATTFRLLNRLAEPTDLQWHGLRLPNALDGVPGLSGQATPAGASCEVTMTPQESGTAWFHPGALPGLADQTARGLAGVLIVEEASPPVTDADRVLVLTDRWEPDAAPSDPSAPRPAAAPESATGAIGGVPALDRLLWVNRKAWPERVTLPPRARLRLRIINASTRQALAAAVEGGRPYVIAIDGQPSELFEPLSDSVPVGPGARFDLMLDLPDAPGAEVRLVLQSAERARVGGVALVLRTEGVAAAEKPPIAPLPANPSLPPAIPLEASARATLKFAPAPLAAGRRALWSVNAVVSEGLPKKPLFSVKRNSPVTLALTNAGKVLTAIRLHGHVMRLLHALDDGWEPYWRDSVIVPPGLTHHVAFLADNPGRWLIESAFADQAAAGLRCWFEVA
jgi:FtsP/CotA-like multicopper oxidase with cupredoxin domain